jgi:spermidine/putrescine transport system substrate-binding protein
MSEDQQVPQIDPSFLRGMTQRRVSRRDLFKYAGAGAGALSLSAILAACGGGSSAPGGGGGATSQDPSKIFAGEPNGKVNFANWPLYIDKGKDKDGNVIYPSLIQFKKETGIDVNYQDVINSNEEFFGKLQPQLQAGDSTGWDIIVITNGQQFTVLTENGWVTPLDTTKRPNFDKNAAEWAKDPTYDPGNKYSMAWQSGITGIAVNTDLTDIEVKSAQDLFKLPQGSVGMLTGDMPDWTMIQLGIDPQTSGPAEWKEAAAWLTKLRDSGVIRGFYGQDYTTPMTQGNLVANMAWSGDVLYYGLWAGYPNLQFVFPADGALLWIDNMLIPQGAENPVDAMTLMDYVYRPDVATMIAEWVLYMSPVPETQKLIAADAAKFADKYKGYSNKLEQTSESPYLFPSQDFLSQTSFGVDLKTDDERREYNGTFLPISES